MDSTTTKMNQESTIPTSPTSRPNQPALIAYELFPRLSRPLPPPESRTRVIAECKSKKEWELVDDDAEILICRGTKRLKVDEQSSNGFNYVETKDGFSNPSISTIPLPETSKDDGETDNVHVLPAKKHKRLIVSDRALEIASKAQDDKVLQSGNYRDLLDEALQNFSINSNTGERNSPVDQLFVSQSPQSVVVMGKGAANGKTIETREHTESRELRIDGIPIQGLSRKENDESMVRNSATLREVLRGENGEDQNMLIQDSPPSTTSSPSESIWKTKKSSDVLEREKKSEEKSRQLREQALSKKLGSPLSTNGSTTRSSSLVNKYDGENINNSSESPDYALETLEQPGLEPEGGLEDLANERLLDIAQNHASKNADIAKPVFRDNLKLHRSRTEPNALNPASRLAAEKFRTQNRHIDQNMIEDSIDDREQELAEGEQRLRMLIKSNEKQKKANRVRYLPYEANDFVLQDEMLETPKSPENSRFISHNNFDLFQGTQTYIQDSDTNNGTRQCSPQVGNNLASGPYLSTQMGNHSSTLFQPISRVEGRLTPQANSDHARTKPVSKATSKDGPLPLDELTLPSNFGQLNPEFQTLIVEHERLKERLRDIQVIKPLFIDISRLRCLGNLTDSEERELQDARRFVARVVDQRLPGKFSRKRASAIRGKFKRKADDYEDLPEENVLYWFVQLLGQTRIDRLNLATEETEMEIQSLQTARHKMSKQRNRTRVKVKLPSRPGVEKQVRATRESYLEKIERQLKLFKATGKGEKLLPPPDPSIHQQSAENDDTVLENDNSESEEDEGAEYVFGAGRVLRESQSSMTLNGFTDPAPFPQPQSPGILEEQDINEINQLENERQNQGKPLTTVNLTRHQIDSQTASPGQPFHLDLFLRMQHQKNKLNAKARLQNRNANDDVDVVSISSSTSTSSDSDFSSASSQTSEIFQYRVFARLLGFQSYDGSSEYHFKTTYSLEKANKVVSSLVQQFLHEHSSTRSERWTLKATHHEDGMLDQLLTVGSDASIQAHVWVTKKLICPRDRAYRRARRYAGSRKSNDVFAVDWIKIRTSEIQESDPKASEDEVFGPEATPMIASSTTTENAPSSSIVLFRLASEANRRAKEVFIAWYATMRCKLEEEHARNMLDDACEAQLRRLGEVGLWDREEVVETNDENEGRQVITKEKMRVWVRKINVYGPWN